MIQNPMSDRTGGLSWRSSGGEVPLRCVTGAKIPKIIEMPYPVSGANSRCRSAWRSEGPARFLVPDHYQSWSIPFPDYAPPEYTGREIPAHLRSVDPKTIRQWMSHLGEVRIDPVTQRPLNPFGRTGLAGRGVLYLWGPNQAVDLLLTRPGATPGVVEIFLIRRADTGRLAPTGGFIDDTDPDPEAAQLREFKEEVGGELPGLRPRIFHRGYVDDYRNTDNAWIETTVGHLHLLPEQADALQTHLTDEAIWLGWVPIHGELKDELNPSHFAAIRMCLEAMRERGGWDSATQLALSRLPSI